MSKYVLFVGHGFVEHVRTYWKGNHTLQYHRYLTSKETELKGSVAIAFNTLLRCMAEFVKMDACEEGYSKEEHNN